MDALLQILGFTSFWNTIFNLLAYTGLLIFTWGIVDNSRQAWFFFIGGIMVWSFAVFGGNPIFVSAQTIMTVASLMRVRKTPSSSIIIVFITTLMLVGMYFRGDINSPLRWLGTLGLLGLVLGVAFAQSLTGNIFFFFGGSCMAAYAYLVNSPPFFVLNIIFNLAVIWEMSQYFFRKKAVVNGSNIVLPSLHRERMLITEKRIERLHFLKQYFLKNLVEDPIDGSTFDCDVLDAFKALEKKYENE